MASFLARGTARARTAFARGRFERVAAGILSTPPLAVSGDQPLFLSQICHRDIAAYLLAIKSLYRAVGSGQIMAIDDGSLTTKDRAVLAFHLPGIEFVPIDDIATGACPRGGTWERLVKIVELSADNYVIQADADTIVSGPIPEVVACWRSNRSFLLGTNAGLEVAPAPLLAQQARRWAEDMQRPAVGTLAEAALDELAETRERNYVHASSGFAGFAKGAFRLEDLQRFSSAMQRRLGERWTEWGSEQIASNYLIANAPDAVVLPLERFACHEPHLEKADRPFWHFIGRYRFDGGLYRRTARKVLRQFAQ